jgi:hypothetical protein
MIYVDREFGIGTLKLEFGRKYIKKKVKIAPPRAQKRNLGPKISMVNFTCSKKK